MGDRAWKPDAFVATPNWVQSPFCCRVSKVSKKRVLSEAYQWLDRIDEAYEVELRYDRIEAIQKLLPQWKSAVEAVKKSLEGQPEPPKKPLLDLTVLLRSTPLPPMVAPRPALVDQPA
jgi:hypothetical protein